MFFHLQSHKKQSYRYPITRFVLKFNDFWASNYKCHVPTGQEFSIFVYAYLTQIKTTPVIEAKGTNTHKHFMTESSWIQANDLKYSHILIGPLTFVNS